VVTFSGALVRPLEPDLGELDIGDIAHGLSCICRWNGATRSFYSVAQHSVLVSRLLPHEHALAGLLHDASEALLSDVVRPLKYAADFAAFYIDAEEKLMRAIAERFRFAWPLASAVHEADQVVLRTEMRDLIPPVRPIPPGTMLPAAIRAMATGARGSGVSHRVSRARAGLKKHNGAWRPAISPVAQVA